MLNSIPTPVRVFILVVLLAVVAVFLFDPLMRHCGYNF